jgi:hypothetical protein
MFQPDPALVPAAAWKKAMGVQINSAIPFTDMGES